VVLQKRQKVLTVDTAYSRSLFGEIVENEPDVTLCWTT